MENQNITPDIDKIDQNNKQATPKNEIPISEDKNRLAPILTFSSESDEPQDQFHFQHNPHPPHYQKRYPRPQSLLINGLNEFPSSLASIIQAKRVQIEGAQMKSMISRSCMTSREPSDLESHLSPLNNYEINFQGIKNIHLLYSNKHFKML